MRYPAYIKQNGKGDYTATFPDLPDVVVSAPTLEEMERYAAEAIDEMFDGHLPIPSRDINQPDALLGYEGGFWVFMDLTPPLVAQREKEQTQPASFWGFQDVPDESIDD